MNEVQVKQTARFMRITFVKQFFTLGELTREEAEELLNLPLSPGDESTLVDDRELLGLSSSEIMAILFPQLPDEDRHSEKSD